MSETSRTFFCEFCQVRHFIDTSPWAGLFLEPRQKIQGELVYLPFWRVRGMALALDRGCRTRHRLVDTSLATVHGRGLPISLGLRAQAMHLRFIEPDTEGRFVRPGIGMKKVRDMLAQSIPGVSDDQKGSGRSGAFVGDIFSLVHIPYILGAGKMTDALTGGVVSVESDVLELLDGAEDKPLVRFPRLVPALCPECGWDLHGPEDSMGLVCSNCRRMSIIHKGRVKSGGLRFLDRPETGDICLPVWELHLSNERAGLETFADLIRLANLPMVPQPRHADMPLTFRIPAFKVHPGLFLRLAAQFSLFELQEPGEIRPRDLQFFPVTLPAQEAFQAASMVLLHLAPHKKGAARALAASDFRLRSARLAHIPFAVRSTEYLQRSMNISMQKQALAWGRML